MAESRRDGLVQAGIVLASVATYELLRLALRPDWRLALAHARQIEGWERAEHLAWEAPVQHGLLAAPSLVPVLNAFYLGANFAVTGAFLVWLYRRSRRGFRLIRNGFLLATGAALLVAWRFPTAPPRTAGLGVEDTLRRFSGIEIGSPGSRALTDPVAAMPSLHAGWALGVALGVGLYAGPLALRLAAPLYPAAVVLAILATGNHFVVDALAGLLLMAAALGLAALAESGGVVRFRLRRGVEQPGSSPGS